MLPNKNIYLPHITLTGHQYLTVCIEFLLLHSQKPYPETLQFWSSDYKHENCKVLLRKYVVFTASGHLEGSCFVRLEI